GRAKSSSVTASKFGAGLLVYIPGCHAIGRRASEHIVFILPNAGRAEQSIPQIEFRFPKSCIAADDLGGQSGRPVERIEVLPELLTELVTGRHRQWFHNLNIVLPFKSVTRRVDLGVEREWNIFRTCHKIALNRARARHKALGGSCQGQFLRPPIRKRLRVAASIDILCTVRLGTKHVGRIGSERDWIEGETIEIGNPVNPSKAKL